MIETWARWIPSHQLMFLLFSSATNDKAEFTAPPSIELPTQFLPAKTPDAPAAFTLPHAFPDEAGEPSESYHPQTQTADSQQLFPPLFEPKPVKPPSPPPKPQPVYSDEVRMIFLLINAFKLFLSFFYIAFMFFPSFRTSWLS